MNTVFRQITIIGLGLIGSSVARAIRRVRPAIRLRGYDNSAAVRGEVRELNLVDELFERASEATSNSDLVILCVPVGSIRRVAQDASAGISPSAIVIDVGSSKSLASAVLRQSLPNARIVPAHPFAGSERSGPAAGSAELFRDRWCILTPDEHAALEDVEAVASFWRSLGSRVEIMSAEQHDLVAAAISHVPHLLAFSSVAAVTALEEKHGQPFIKFASGGFHDFTRLAAANPLVWKDVFLSNKSAIIEVCALFRNMAGMLERLIEDGDEDALLGALEKPQLTRLNMSLGS